MARQNQCTICKLPNRSDIDHRINSGQSGHRVSKDLDVSVAALYRHIGSGHHIAKPQEGTQLPVGATNGAGLDPSIKAQVSKSLRQAERLMGLAWKHLRAIAPGEDAKATNGAITATNKTLELIAKLKGELQAGSQVNVSVSSEARVAMDSHAAAQALDSGDVTEQARAWLCAQIEAGDEDAQRVVLGLVRMVRSADATVDT